MLFHSLYQPDRSIYRWFLHAALPADLNVVAFKRAWQSLVDRYEVLRCSFAWEGI